jgi:hypothetical protein
MRDGESIRYHLFDSDFASVHLCNGVRGDEAKVALRVQQQHSAKEEICN